MQNIHAKLRQNIMCTKVPFMINVRNQGTIGDTFLKLKYHFWYIFKTKVPFMNCLFQNVTLIHNMHPCYFVCKTCIPNLNE
jgi:hypothetical protein